MQTFLNSCNGGLCCSCQSFQARGRIVSKRAGLLILVGLLLALSVVAQEQSHGSKASAATAKAASIAQRAPESPAEEVFRSTSKGVFVIEVFDNEGKRISLGSGVLVGKNTVVTNKHVLSGGAAFTIRAGKFAAKATVVHVDADHDLAELTFVGQYEAFPMPLRTSESLHIGECVYAVGAPEGLELTISEGILSGIRELAGNKLLQTTAAISHGSSGGGLFDSQGHLIGITSLSLRGTQNINFAHPVDDLRSLESAGSRLNPASEESDPSDILIDFAHAEAAVDAGDYETALKHFTAALEKNPKPLARACIYLALSAVHEMMGNIDRAVMLQQKAVAVCSGDEKACQGISEQAGYSLVRYGRYKEAAELFQTLLIKDPRDWKALHGAALVALLTQNLNLAEPLLVEADQIHPNDYQVLGTLLIVYSRQSRCQEVAALARRLRALYPENEGKIAPYEKCPQ